jgi:hypothetical protein
MVVIDLWTFLGSTGMISFGSSADLPIAIIGLKQARYAYCMPRYTVQ